MNIRLTAREKIQVLNGKDLFAIMQRVLLREARIDRGKEHFWIVGLDSDNRILFVELVVLGGVTSATVKPMEAFRVAVLKNAVSAILVHNHTAANLTPSDADKDLTDRLIQVGRILHIPVLDHLIITTEAFLSFQHQGLMDKLRKSLKWVPPFEIEERIRDEKARIRAEEARLRAGAVREAREEGEREGKSIGMRKGLRVGRAEGIEVGEEWGFKKGKKEGMEIGIEKGMQEGERKGKEEGLREGERKGEERGRKEGRREGRKEGQLEGREEGRKERSVEVARAALARGLDIGMVAEISGLSEEEIARLKKDGDQ